jgi:hypothetical protein
MSTKDAYKQKIEAELELAQAKLLELKAHVKNSTADVRIKYAKLSDDLEHRYETTKSKLKELNDAGDEAWEKLKGGVEHAWKDLKQAIHEATA